MNEISQNLKIVRCKKRCSENSFSERRWADLLFFITNLSRSFITLEPCSYDRYSDLLSLTDDVFKSYNINCINASLTYLPFPSTSQI